MPLPLNAKNRSDIIALADSLDRLVDRLHVARATGQIDADDVRNALAAQRCSGDGREDGAGDASSRFRQEAVVHHLVKRPRTILRKRRFRQTGFPLRADQRIAVGIDDGFVEHGLQAWIFPKVALDPVALLLDRQAPTVPPEAGLETPFQQMEQQHGQPALQLLLLTAPHAFDFLCKVLQVQIDVAALRRQPPQPAGLILRPGKEVAVVEPCIRHGQTLRSLNMTRSDPSVQRTRVGLAQMSASPALPSWSVRRMCHRDSGARAA